MKNNKKNRKRNRNIRNEKIRKNKFAIKKILLKIVSSKAFWDIFAMMIIKIFFK